MTAAPAAPPAGADHQEAMRRLDEEQADLQLDRFDADLARRLGERLITSAPGPVAVRIRIGQRLLYGACAADAVPNNEIAAELKLNVVARWGRSSLWLHHWLRSTGRTVADLGWLDPRTLMDLGGGLPLVVGGLAVGGVAVSGLPHTDDHELVVAALGAIRRES